MKLVIHSFRFNKYVPYALINLVRMRQSQIEENKIKFSNKLI